ncbi:hypothetical protein WJ67_06545 [Burkholderia ubonensis]|nr:hypothetical protein WJ67_06545 [Burkholderia ubonensis]
MTIDNFVLRLIRFSKIQNRNRNIQYQGFDKTTSLTIIPNILALNIRQMKQTTVPLISKRLHGQINWLRDNPTLSRRKNEILLVIELPKVRYVFVRFLCHFSLTGTD